MLVLDDAPLKRTVDGALRACFSNAGQLCISMERMYVVDAIYDTFVPRFAEATRKLELGGDLGYGADMGCLISPRQLATVSEHVDDARAQGATVLAGGRARPDLGPSFYEPTVLQGVTPAMTAYATETFGPVVSIYRVTGVEEAIARANESDYGLNFSVWSADTKRAHHLATRLQAGTVGINEGYASGWGSVDAPMGGFKDSGIGRRHGEHGIVKYTDAADRLGAARPAAIGPAGLPRRRLCPRDDRGAEAAQARAGDPVKPAPQPARLNT
jgi:succinate-semialdehyde dehydrogenase / glutarate-semialdehyde dehydrogenase